MPGSFKELLRAALAKSGKTNADLARDLEVSDPFVHYLLAGRKTPTIARLERIREALHVNPEDYEALFNALIRENPDFSALDEHIRSRSFSEFYLPFLRAVLKKSKMVSDFKEGGFGVLDSDLWLGYVSVVPKRYHAGVKLRFFLSKPTEKGIAVAWTIYPNKEPDREAVWLPFSFSPLDVIKFDNKIKQEPAIRHFQTAHHQQNKIYEG